LAIANPIILLGIIVLAITAHIILMVTAVTHTMDIALTLHTILEATIGHIIVDTTVDIVDTMADMVGIMVGTMADMVGIMADTMADTGDRARAATGRH
jgi:phage-related holin